VPLSPPEIRGRLLLNEPMARHTSLKVGGPADIFAIPMDSDDLQSLVSQLAAAGLPWLVVGKGYNLLVKDGGIRGAVISLERFTGIEAREAARSAGRPG